MRVYNLYVYGKVQRVEFRRYILDLAQELSLAGQIKNLSDGSVEIFIQGDEKILLKFIELIKQPPIGIVKDIKIKEAIVKPKMKKFTIVYGKLADELQEDFGAMQEVFIQYWKEFRNYREEFRDFTKRTDENFKLILNKYGEISEKLTIILETLVKESKETREMLNETMKLLKEALEKISSK